MHVNRMYHKHFPLIMCLVIHCHVIFTIFHRPVTFLIDTGAGPGSHCLTTGMGQSETIESDN